jgi:DNA polymerase-3 subunit delta'
MNTASQNKLLKTLEEPSKNVHLILGATNEHALLPTVKSRVKKLEIPSFQEDTLFTALKDECTDLERLKEAITFSDGTVGGTLSFYGNEDKTKLLDLATDVIVNMKSSKQVLDYSIKSSDPEGLIGALEIIFKDMLLFRSGGVKEPKNRRVKQAIDCSEGFSVGAIIYALDKVLEAKKRIKFNGNETAVLEWLLFSILEGKYKWQKL